MFKQKLPINQSVKIYIAPFQDTYSEALLTQAKSSSIPGGAAEHAVDRKRNKYATLPASHEFVPIAVETLGPFNREGREFLLELGRRGAGVSGDLREAVFLFQRLSICIQ